MKKIQHKEVRNFIGQAKIGVLPNSYDGDSILFTSPLKLYEYLGAGLRVVSSRLPSIESSMDNDLIYWAIPENVNSLSSAIITAYKDNNYNSIKAKNFSKNYTWDKRSKNFLSYSELYR